MLSNIWEEFLIIVRQEAGSQVVETWLKAVALQRWDSINKIIYLHAPNEFVKEWINTKYLALFHTHLSRLLNVDSLKVVFSDQNSVHKETGNAEVATIIPAQRVQDFAQESKNALVKKVIKQPRSAISGTLNPNYQFGSFVVGPNNQLAYAAAQAVTDKLGRLYNPLFIYGNSGLGKTHLLHAIGNEIKNKYKKVEVLYQTADRFVNEFINAIRFDKVHQFQTKYKDIDVLLIDDVQFISNKEQTQEAFFHIFNALYESHKQIVFSGDSYPSDIKGLAERLRSRLEGGLVTDIQVPSIETKIAILKRKAELNNEVLPDEVAAFIAQRVVSNIRELEGALIRVLAFSTLTQQPITLELAKKVLYRTPEVQEVRIDFERIANLLCKNYSCSLADLRARTRNKQFCHVRQIAMYLMKNLTGKSLREIGFFLHRKDHSTVLHAIAKVEEMVQEDQQFKHQIKRLEEELLR